MKKTIVAALSLLILFTACNTAPPESSIPVIKEQAGDIEFELVHISAEELKKQYGYDNNPFYNYPGKVPRKYVMVFDCHISTQTSIVNINLEDIVMDLDIGYSDNAKTRSTLLSSWKPYIDSDADEDDMKRIIKKEVSENKITVSPDNPYKAYVVFIIKTKGATEATINIPAETEAGDKGVVSLTFSLSDETEAQGSGIFDS